MNDAWWREAIIYQVYPRSFQDSNGDGIGDLEGIRSRLPYLRELGVNAIWISPFYPSPQFDQGYDVASYVGVDSDYGDLDDFTRLVSHAHEHGIRVIIDIVPNHCSILHPLFVDALESAPGDAARARFHFADGRGANGELPPNNWRSMFGGSAWQRIPDGQWYLHLFTPEQPDFNWRNPLTVEFFDSVLRFWLDRGVDGFRIDAAQGLFKAEGLPDALDPFEEERVHDAANPAAWNQPEVHRVYRRWRQLVDEYATAAGEDRVLVGEITGLGSQYLSNYIGHDQLHQGFFFDFMHVPWNAGAITAVIDRGLAKAATTGSTVTWVLGNHDTVRVATRFASGAPGVSRGDVALGELRADAAAMLMFALPGSAYIYQGDELGLPEVVDLSVEHLRDPIYRTSEGLRRGRDGCRVPLPWAGSEAPFAFSADGTQTWLPQPAYFADHAAARELEDGQSHWHTYQRAIELRARQLASWSEFEWLRRTEEIFAFRRNQSFVCVVNTSGHEIPVPWRDEPTLTSSPCRSGYIAPNTCAWWDLELLPSQADWPPAES